MTEGNYVSKTCPEHTVQNDPVNDFDAGKDLQSNKSPIKLAHPKGTYPLHEHTIL